MAASSVRRKNPALAAALAASGKTARQLAAETHLHPNTISGILCQRYGTTQGTARKIAAALNLPVQSLGLAIGPDRRPRGVA